MYRQLFIVSTLLLIINFPVHAQVSYSLENKANINTPITPFKLRASTEEKVFNKLNAGGYCLHSPHFDTTWAQQFQNTLDYLINVSGVPGGSLAVLSPDHGYFYGVSGVSYDTIPISPDMRFGVGSNTKLFIATTLLKLQEEGLLSLDDPLYQWLPSIEYIDSTTTIRQMLSHRSGFFDYFNDNISLLVDSTYADTSRFWTVDEILATIGAPHFAPGLGWIYSNTNYMLSGEIIEAASGDSWVDMLHDEIFDPLQLDSTFVGAFEPRNGPVAAEWDAFSGEVIINSPMTAQYSMMHGAGGILSAAMEMVSWYNSLFNAEIINTSSLQEMVAFEPAFYYGLGIWGTQYNGRLAYMHTGGTLGYLSMMYYDVQTETILCVLYNGRDAVQGQFNDLLEVLYDDFPLRENDAGISNIMAPWTNICEDSFHPKVILTNHGSETLSSASIHYFIDEEPAELLNWTGSLGNGDTVLLTLNIINTTEGPHTFTCYTTLPNGQTEGYTFNDTATSKFIVNTQEAIPLPFDEDFEGEVFPPDGWSLNSNSQFSWRSNTTNYAGSHTSMKNNYQDGSFGFHYDLVLPPLNLSGVNPTLSFDYAYARYPGNAYDSLQVMISTDCGNSWGMLFNKGGSLLSTAAPTYDPFYPDSPNDWEYETILLNGYVGDVIIKFRSVCGVGNNLYLDDIFLDYAIGINNVPDKRPSFIFPNPATDIITIRTGNPEPYELLIYDMTGGVLLRSANMEDGQVNVSYLPAGLYFVEFIFHNEIRIEKLIVL